MKLINFIKRLLFEDPEELKKQSQAEKDGMY